MKKITLLLFTLFFISAFANAQMTITPYGQVDYSRKFVENTGWCYTGWEGLYTRPKLSYAFGADVQYNFTPNWSIKTGLMFQEMGNNMVRKIYISEEKGYLNLYSKVSLQFINIPLQAQYNFRASKRFSPYIALGGTASRNISGSKTTTRFYSNEGIETTTKTPIAEIAYLEKKYNFSIKTDIGFTYKLNEKLSLNTFISRNVQLLKTSISPDAIDRYYNNGLGVGLSFKV